MERKWKVKTADKTRGICTGYKRISEAAVILGISEKDLFIKTRREPKLSIVTNNDIWIYVDLARERLNLKK
jgi:hypothetical protein